MADNLKIGDLALSPNEELERLKDDRNFAGGTAFGRVGSGIVDLRSNQIVPGTAQFGTDPIATSGIRRHITPATSDTFKTEADKFFSGLDRTDPTAGEEEDIRAQEIERVQKQIDAINDVTTQLIAEEREVGQERLGRGRAISARSGVLGGDFGDRRTRGIEDINKREEEIIRLRQQDKINAILGKADTRAQDRIDAEKNRNLKNTEAFLNFKKSQQDDARADLKDLAGAGVSLDVLSDEQYTRLLDDSGLDQVLFEAVHNANLPKNAQGEFSYINIGGGKLVRVNKAGGEPVEFDFSVPSGFEFKMAGDVPVFINPDTQEVKVATVQGGGSSVFEKKDEIELDTFTNADGDRVSVMFDKKTGKTRQIVHGAAEDSGVKFDPDPVQMETVTQYISDNSTDPESELKLVRTNEAFFLHILKLAEGGE